jgi:AraC-like DNA-binding protein
VVCFPPRTGYAERSVAGFISLYLAVEGLPLPGIHVSRMGDDPRFALAARLVLEEARRSADPGRDCAAALALLVRALLRGERRAPAHPLVDAAVELVHRHAPDPGFDARALARRAGTTPRRLRRAFLAALGQTPLRYLTARRIEAAKLLLARGGFAVRDVAERVGFADPYYFSRAFRRATGHSPRAWRERAAG